LRSALAEEPQGSPGDFETPAVLRGTPSSPPLAGVTVNFPA
jgi:hypothetical protein